MVESASRDRPVASYSDGTITWAVGARGVSAPAGVDPRKVLVAAAALKREMPGLDVGPYTAQEIAGIVLAAAGVNSVPENKDALWAAFERAVDAAVKSGPIHKEREPSKPGSRRGSNVKADEPKHRPKARS